MVGLVESLQPEYLQSESNPIIIANGGYLRDFPILLASCMKHKYYNFTALAWCMYLDSMQILRDAGYRRPGLDALSLDLNIERKTHSALMDAITCNKKPEMFGQPHGYTVNGIVYRSTMKLHIPIQKVYNLGVECTWYQELTSIFYEYLTPKDCISSESSP